MTEPITAIVTTFNGKGDLRDCLRSLLASDVPFREVIVVDNASTDGTPEMVRAEFPAARLIVMERNDGPCASRNRGLEAAATRLVFQLDHDVVVRTDCVRRLLPHLEDGVAVAFPRALDANDLSVVHYDGGSFHYAGVMVLRHFYRQVGECTTQPEDVDAFISLAALVDRDLVHEVGAYDPAFFILFEDHDLSYRLRAAGRRIRSVPDAIVEHRSGTAGISFRGGLRYPARRLFLHSRNRWLVVLKCYRWRTFLLALPGILLLGVVYVAFSVREGALLDYLKAKGSLIRLLPHILQERKRMTGLRRVRDRDLLGSPDLTFSPRIRRGGASALLERTLSAVLRAWFVLVRRLLA